MNTKEHTPNNRPLQKHLIAISKIIKKPMDIHIVPMEQAKKKVIAWMAEDGSPLPYRTSPSNPHGLSYRDSPAPVGGQKDGNDHA